jgi:hypothetical protein
MKVNNKCHRCTEAEIQNLLPAECNVVCGFSPSSCPQQKQTPWPLVRKRTIPTERPPLVDEI